MIVQRLRLKTRQTLHGFSLLELLLVIVILGVLASFGLTVYQKKSDTTKINKAILEMQSIMQAASAFYLTGSSGNINNPYNRWPAYEGLTDKMPDYFSGYLPLPTNTNAVTMTNPWGTPYFIDGSSNYKFKVQTKVPNATIAQQLASSLPYGAVDSKDNTTVYAYISAPGQQLSLGLIFKEIGVAKNGDDIDIPQDCPSGTTPSVVTAVNYVRTDLSDVSAIMTQPYSATHIVASPMSLLSAEATAINATQWQLNISLMKVTGCTTNSVGISEPESECKDKKQSGKWNGKTVEAKMLYIVYCKPATTEPK